MEILMAILYCFHQMFANMPIGSKLLTSNLDLLFLLAPIGILFVIFRKHRSISLLILFVLPVVIYGVFQCIVLEGLDMVKLLVNVSKVTLCISLMVSIMIKLKDFNIKKFIDYVSIIFLLFSPIALALSNSTYLWRLNDTINKYNTVRLNMFYIEPSELGFHLSILIIILLYLIIKEKVRKVRVKFIIYLANYLFLLFLSKAFGASLILLLSIVIVLLVIIVKNISYKNILVGYGVVIAFAGFIIFSVATQSSMYMRAMDTLNGSDDSNNYRVGVTQNFTSTALSSSNGIGIGLGNLNTDKTKADFKETGMTDVVAASFPYFISEGGVFAIVYSVFLMGLLCIKAIRKQNMMLISLFIFMLSYQIYGGYFTNPVNWLVYGLIIKWNDDIIS